MKMKRFFVLILFCVYMFSSCAAAGHNTNNKFSSGYFPEEGSYVLNCKGVSNLAAACKTNFTDLDSVTRLTLQYIDNINIRGISKFKNLEELIITDSDLAEKDISFLNKNIKSLVLYRCENIDYTQIPHTLSALSLHYIRNGNADLAAVAEMDNITSLSLTCSDIDRQSELSLLKQLTSLEITGDLYSDDGDSLTMPFLSDLTNLKALKLYNVRCLKFDAVSNLKQLEELSVSDLGNVSYEALSEFSNLRILDTTMHYFRDHELESSDVFYYYDPPDGDPDGGSISAIENMPELQVLKCTEYPGDKLKACKKLKEVMLVCNNVDLNDFDSLDDLEKLSVSVNNIVPSKTKLNIKEFEYNSNNHKADLSFIGELTELEKLKVDYNNVKGIGTDMSYLSNCTKLKSLYIRDSHWTKKEVFDISFVSAMKELEELSIYNIMIKSAKPISDLHNLRSLTLCDCCLCNIEALRNLKSLEYVDLVANMISDISPLEDLKCISYLDLEYNKLNDISAVSGLENIRHLNIKYNAVKDINAVSGMDNIEYLDITFNRICDLTPISGKRKLKYLDISLNNITDSNWAKDLDSLEKFKAHDFGSTDLDFIYSFPSILEMDIGVRSNLIEDYEQFTEECDRIMESFPDAYVYIGAYSRYEVVY